MKRHNKGFQYQKKSLKNKSQKWFENGIEK